MSENKRRASSAMSSFSPLVAPGTASSPLPGRGVVALSTEATASATTAVVVDPPISSPQVAAGSALESSSAAELDSAAGLFRTRATPPRELDPAANELDSACGGDTARARAPRRPRARPEKKPSGAEGQRSSAGGRCGRRRGGRRWAALRQRRSRRRRRGGEGGGQRW
ncbi:unnamed protein product [Urochloa humidicola]